MKKNLLLTSIFTSVLSLSAFAQNADVQAAKDANNPLASTKSISVHNIYSPSICGTDGTMNTAWLRYAQPFGRVLMRASLPINSVNMMDVNRSGFGDFNIFATYLLSKPSSHKQFGIGPLLSVPTAEHDELGTGKWHIGAAFIGYFDASPVFQFGFLTTWQHSFAGEKCRNKVHNFSFQPFLMWQMGNGVYLRSTAITLLDFENGNYLLPFGLGLGKVIKIGNTICNLFAEPQFTAWNKGSGLPKTQIFFGINTQF